MGGGSFGSHHVPPYLGRHPDLSPPPRRHVFNPFDTIEPSDLELGTVDPRFDHQSAQQTVAGDRERASRRPFFNFALVEVGSIGLRKQPVIDGLTRCYAPSVAGAISTTLPDYYSNIETNGSITAKRAHVPRLRFLNKALVFLGFLSASRSRQSWDARQSP
jgi:hypothetical protein